MNPPIMASETLGSEVFADQFAGLPEEQADEVGHNQTERATDDQT